MERAGPALGLAPALLSCLLLTGLRAPDVLISGDGRHVGITGEAAGELLLLRETRSDFARDNLTELAGMSGETRPLDQWPGARCNRDFCTIRLIRGGRPWQLLLSRGEDMVAERELAAACDRADIVISDRYLPRSCRPRWLKVDRNRLAQSGGLTLDFTARQVRAVADGQGQHGWWSPPPPRIFKPGSDRTSGPAPIRPAQTETPAAKATGVAVKPGQ